jgi:hypothetical protein
VLRVIKDGAPRIAGLEHSEIRPMLPGMSEADDLARRFFALWPEYLAALFADPNTAEPLRAWLTAAGAAAGFRTPEPARDDGAGSSAGAAAAAGPPGRGDAALVELARRVDELAERVAALERGAQSGASAAAGRARRNRPARS